jgi:hypothetical protein
LAHATDKLFFKRSHQRQFEKPYYIDLDRKGEAKVLLQTAYQTLLKILGAEHPNTVNIQTWFAYVD